MADEKPEALEAEWIENVQTWFYKGNLWGGVVFSRECDDVKVTVTNYMKLTRTVSATFESYEDALGTIGFYIDEYVADQQAALG